MPHKEEVKDLLSKLGTHVQIKVGNIEKEPLIPIHPCGSSMHKKHGSYPGESYKLVGNSYNVDFKLLGTEIEARRSGCLTLLLAWRGNRSHCVRLDDALSFEGFCEILSSLEHDWLRQLPEDTFIGPALDQNGQRLRTEFAVWQNTIEKTTPNKLSLTK